METLKILMVSTFFPPYHIGGDAVHVKYLSDELTKKGHEVHVIHSFDAYQLKKGNKEQLQDDDSVHTHKLQTPLGPASAACCYVSGRNNSAERLVDKVSKEISPDAIHYHNISLLGCGVLNQGTGKKIYTAHDHWAFCQRNDHMKFGKDMCNDRSCISCAIGSHRPIRLISSNKIVSELKKLDVIVSPSSYMKQMLSSFGLNSIVVKNFVPRPENVCVKDIDPYFIYAGVLEKHKGIDTLVNAYHRSKCSSELHILGSGSLFEHISKINDERIKVLGFRPKNEVLSEIASSLCMVAPSKCGENSPLSCIESLSVGVPLIVSPNGGLPEIAAGCGIITSPTEKNITSAINSIEENKELRNSMSQNAIKNFEEQHSPERYMKQYYTFLEENA